MRRALLCGGALLACWQLASLTRRPSYFLPLFARRDIFSAPAALLAPRILYGPVARPHDGEFEAWVETYSTEYDHRGANRRVEFAKFGDEAQVSVTSNPSGLESVHPTWASDRSWHAVARSRGQRLRATKFRESDGFSFLDVILEGGEIRESLTLMAHAGTLWTLSCAAETSRWDALCPPVVDSFRPGFDQWTRW